MESFLPFARTKFKTIMCKFDLNRQVNVRQDKIIWWNGQRLSGNKGLLLRQVAAFLEVDTTFLNKMERNEKKASKQQVVKLAKALETSENDLMTLWLSDKIIETLSEESEAHNVLKLTEKRLKKN